MNRTHSMVVRWRRLRLLLAALVVPAVLAGCGGGMQNFAGGGIVGTGSAPIVAVGTITGFGNGTIMMTAQQFALTGTSITVDDQPASVDALKVGMVVAVQGDQVTDGTLVARSIAYRADARGVVDGVDTTGAAFTVLGQRVPVNKLTVFDGGTFATLLSQYVEVSGYRAEAGDLVATRVEFRPTYVAGVTPLQVTGAVSALDATARSLMVGAQAVDFSQLAPAQIPAGLGNGAVVDARGTNVTASGALIATSLAVVTPTPPATSGTTLEVEGYVTEFASVASFKVNGQPVDATSATADGGTLDMIVDNAKLEVHGRLQNGVLIASSIEFEDVPAIVLDGLVDNIDPGVRTLSVAGQIVTVRATTQFEDLSAAALRDFGFSSIALGDRLTVRAVHAASVLVAQRIERRDRTAPPPSTSTTQVDGAITALVSVADFVVGGRNVNANSATFSGGTAANLAVGVRVHVEGTLTAGVVIAQTVQILPPDPAPPTEVELRGAIDSFVSVASFRVAGQTIDASGAQFSGGTAADLANGRYVDVEGLLSAGVVHATSVKFENTTPPTPTIEAEGLISSFVSISSFKIAGQPVDASSAQFTQGHASDLANGREAHAVGPLVTGVLRATTISVEDASGNQQVELEGTISNFVSVSQFTVASRTVDATAATFHGGTAASLANGKRVQINGTLVSNVVRASSVEFDD